MHLDFSFCQAVAANFVEGVWIVGFKFRWKTLPLCHNTTAPFAIDSNNLSSKLNRSGHACLLIDRIRIFRSNSNSGNG